jgi:hypothetical protein
LISTDRRKRLDSHAKIYVVGNGKKTGHEYLTGYCSETGKVLGRHTDRSPNSVSIPRKFVHHLLDKKRRCVLHHNHPGGSSLSREDLFNVAFLPGTICKYAHGHQKQWYQAENLRVRNLEDVLLAADTSFLRVLKAPGMGAVPSFLLNHIFNIGLDKAKVIKYTYLLSKDDEVMYNALDRTTVDALIRAVGNGVSSTKGTLR